MQKITCEMCGSTEIMKENGVFICQNCGVKYSVEEAKKMMTVKIDNSELIENYLGIAQNAYKVDNVEESENYCNKILEIDNNNYEAWLLKGKSSLSIKEAVNCFYNALDNTPEDKVSEVKSEIVKEILSLASWLIVDRCKIFESIPNIDNANSIINKAKLIKSVSTELLLKCGEKEDNLILILARNMNNSAINVANKILYEYSQKQDPRKYDCENFIDGGDAVISVIEMSVIISCGYDSITSTASEYQSLINMQETLIRLAYFKDSGIEYTFSEEEQQFRKDKIMEWHKKWHEIDATHMIPTAE